MGMGFCSGGGMARRMIAHRSVVQMMDVCSSGYSPAIKPSNWHRLIRQSEIDSTAA